jgi:exopolysaccharide biosynthesis protein
MIKLLCALFACSAIASAQTLQIKAGATVYIEPMGGYETYLAAAIVKKQVPLVVVADRSKAEYIIRSTVSQNVPSTPAVVVNNSATVNEGDSPNQQAWNQGWALGQQRNAARAALGSSNVSIAIVDAKTEQIVFAHSAGKGGANQLQKTAEDCAKHLKEFIEKPEKAAK